jgi:hypothetical protein
LADSRNPKRHSNTGKKATASVPLNQTGEHEQHINGDILEFVTLQPDALNDPICATLIEDQSSKQNTVLVMRLVLNGSITQTSIYLNWVLPLADNITHR